jgi:ubiquinone/menaquinone biosynthesis C-methylase UbiE
MSDAVLRANIEVHTRVASAYNETEPQFRPENLKKVRGVLEGLRSRAPGGKMLDLGCGTGFLINLAKDLFDEIHGVDVTQAMLDRVDTSSGNINLHNGPAEKVPFDDGTFDLVTAYSFLHHTADAKAVLAEAFRVLKPGGLFYIDEEPNKLFWDAMSGISDVQAVECNPMIRKARDSVLKTDARLEEQFGLPRELFRQAEYIKAILGGIDPREFVHAARNIGFRDSAVRHEWFLGQAEVMHGRSFEAAAEVEDYLRSVSPLADHLFKYLQFILVK